jgi:putative ABC transport system permease protein
MLKNFFKVIVRDLSKDRIYSFIGILGLSAGISVAIIIIAISFTFLTYDRFHEKGERIYQAFFKNSYENIGEDYSTGMPWNLGETLKENYPEVENTATVVDDSPLIFIADEKKIEQKGCYSEGSLFDIFSFPILASENANENIFVDDNSIAISENVAEKYFGNTFKALGKQIILKRSNQKKEVYVSAVFADIPHNSSLQFDYVLPLQVLVKESEWLRNSPWRNFIASTFIEQKTPGKIDLFNAKIKNYVGERNPSFKGELFFYNYEDVFLHAPGNFDKTINFIFLFAIAAIILGIASINFINLAISRSSKKAKEIGLRKMAGAGRRSLILRFMTETLLLSFCSVVFGMFLSELLIPFINNIFKGFLTFLIPYQNLYFWLSIVCVWALVGLLAGLYPSVYLSSLSPGGILKGISVTNRKITIRKILLTTQFVFSTVFIFLAAVIFKQMRYITDKDLGLNIKQVIEFRITDEHKNHLSAFTQDLKLEAGIEDVTFTDSEPTGVSATTSEPRWEGKPENLKDMFPVMTVGDDFTNTFDIQMLSGRNFIHGEKQDIDNCLVNERMAEIMSRSCPDGILGKEVSYWGHSGRIVGIVKNFHNSSLHESIRPLIIRKRPMDVKTCFVKFRSENFSNVMSHIESIYNTYEKEFPFKYYFLDKQFLNKHIDIKIFGGMFGLFSAIAIIISCLGLFGLTAFNIQQKTKEVGIRKVLGASVKSITFLLTSSLFRPVLTATVIALPIGYYLSEFLLQMFVYKANISSEIYIMSIAFVFLSAVVAVTFLAVKAALANPVESIKYE